MFEKTIYLEGIDPLVMYGVNNMHFDKIRDFFPQLKIVARGHEIFVLGEKDKINDFENRISQIIFFYHKFNRLTGEDLENILNSDEAEIEKLTHEDDVILYGNKGNVIKSKTINQHKLVELYKTNDILFALGPAGTGKTYTAIALAVAALREKKVKRIILTRPAVEAGENLGFLPGDMKEKLDPYLQPLYDALRDMVPSAKLIKYLDEGTIEIAPLAYMRGRTLDNAFVILDEGQNTTVNQMKMFLTRMGRNAKMIITGDMSQIDLPCKSLSGLVKATQILKNIEGIALVNFDIRDVVRHRLVKHIIEAYSKEQDSTNNK